MFGKSYLYKGMELYDSGDCHSAINRLNRALKSGDLDETETYTAYVWKGRCYSRIREYDYAIRELNNALKYDSNHFGAYYELGRIYEGKKDLKQSLMYYEKAIQFKPDDYNLWMLKGLVLSQLKRNEDAEAAMNTALKYVPPSDLETINSIKGNLFAVTIKKDCKKVIEIIENSDSDKYATAIKILESILKRIQPYLASNSNDLIKNVPVDAIRDIGKISLMLGQYQFAITLLKQIVNNYSPDKNDIYNDLGYCYTKLNQYNLALESYDKERKWHKNESDRLRCNIKNLRIFFINTLMNTDYQALLDFTESYNTENNDLKYILQALRIRSLYCLERYDEAIHCPLPDQNIYWGDTDRGPACGQLIEGVAYTYIGGAYYQLKKYHKALMYLDKCFEINCKVFTNTGTFMGECYIALEEYETAIKAFQIAIEAYDDDIDSKKYDVKSLESRIQFAIDKLHEEKSKMPPQITIHGNNNPVNFGGILATDDAVINRSVIGKDSAQEETDMCFCPYCGTKLNSDFLFCPKCGRKQKED